MNKNKKTPTGVYGGCVGTEVRIMSNGIGRLGSVSATNLCRRDEDVLLNTLEDEFTRVPYINITTIYDKSMG